MRIWCIERKGRKVIFAFFLLTSLCFLSLVINCLIANKKHKVIVYHKYLTTEYMLSNGLRLIIKEDHRSPIALVQMCYKVGSSYEPPEMAGISHLLEHMLFEEDKTYYSSIWTRSCRVFGNKVNNERCRLSELLFRKGANINASTSQDFTSYHESLPANDLALALELEAKRMTSTQAIDEEKLAKEKMIVAMEDDEFFSGKRLVFLRNKFNTLAYLESDYKNPIVGWWSNVKNLTAEDLQAWRRLWYAPNNAILIVVGDVNPQEVYNLVQKHFGSIKSKVMPKIRILPDIDDDFGERRVIFWGGHTDFPFIFWGFKVPGLGSSGVDWEPYALQVLRELLDREIASELIEHRLRSNIAIKYTMYQRTTTVFLLESKANSYEELLKLEKTFLKNIKKIKQRLFTEQQLQQAKIRILANMTYSLDDLEDQSYRIVIPETVGIHWLEDQKNWAGKISGVTAEQICQVAEKYFKPNRLIVTIMKPGTEGVHHEE